MITTVKIFGQLKPAAATLTNLCTIAIDKEGQLMLTACNQSASEEKVRVAVVPSGETINPKHYVLYDTPIPANGIGDKPFDLPAGAIMKVYSLGGNVSFTAEGLEVTI